MIKAMASAGKLNEYSNNTATYTIKRKTVVKMKLLANAWLDLACCRIDISLDNRVTKKKKGIKAKYTSVTKRSGNKTIKTPYTATRVMDKKASFLVKGFSFLYMFLMY